MLSKRSFVAPDKIEGQVDNHCPLEAFNSIAVGRTPKGFLMLEGKLVKYSLDELDN